MGLGLKRQNLEDELHEVLIRFTAKKKFSFKWFLISPTSSERCEFQSTL